MICHRTSRRTLSRAATPPGRQIREFCNQTEAISLSLCADEHTYFHFINEHTEMKAGCDTTPFLTGPLKEPTVWLTDEAKQQWLRTTSLERQRAAKGAAWLNLARVQLPEGRLIPRQHFAASLRLQRWPVQVTHPWVRRREQNNGRRRVTKLTTLEN